MSAAAPPLEPLERSAGGVPPARPAARAQPPPLAGVTKSAPRAAALSEADTPCAPGAAESGDIVEASAAAEPPSCASSSGSSSSGSRSGNCVDATDRRGCSCRCRTCCGLGLSCRGKVCASSGARMAELTQDPRYAGGERAEDFQALRDASRRRRRRPHSARQWQHLRNVTKTSQMRRVPRTRPLFAQRSCTHEDLVGAQPGRARRGQVAQGTASGCGVTESDCLSLRLRL